MTIEQIKALKAVADAIIETVQGAGPMGAPGGQYLRCFDGARMHVTSVRTNNVRIGTRWKTKKIWRVLFCCLISRSR